VSRHRWKRPKPEAFRRSIAELLESEADLPPVRCTCHGRLLCDCPDRPDVFAITDEPSARSAERLAARAAEICAIRPDEVEEVLARAARFLPDWRRRLREEGPG
jgi:hypothetical protein